MHVSPPRQLSPALPAKSRQSALNPAPPRAASPLLLPDKREVAGALLRSHGLWGQDAWDRLRRPGAAARPAKPSSCQLVAFLQLVAAGLGYQNAAAALLQEGTGGPWQRQHALPGQLL